MPKCLHAFVTSCLHDLQVGGAPIGKVVPVAAETTLHVFEQLESGKEYSAYFSTEARHANGFLVH